VTKLCRTPRLNALTLSAMTLILLGRSAPAAPPPADHAEKLARGQELFSKHVRAILIDNCLKCHGGAKTQKGFDISTRESFLKGGDNGPVVELWNSKDSRLFDLISHKEMPYMPSKEDKLSDDKIAKIAAWIDLGAPYDRPLIDKKGIVKKPLVVTDEDRQFWSFAPLKRPAVPEVKDAAWCRTPVDRFILAKLNDKGLSPNPVADRRTLIRRATFDLIGLPPEPEEVEKFVNDADPAAYEKLIDKLLASPRHGERWAPHWLDLARFAESHGFEQDYDRPTAYHYRDFVIKAFNSDLPYDKFVKWQIAGDEYEPDNPLALMATGFLAAGVHSTQITKNQVEKERYDELDDMARTVGTAMLGVTIGCARCHDHKYDPIPTRDYYRLLSTFTTTVRSEVQIDLDPKGNAEAKAKYDAEQKHLLARLRTYEKALLPLEDDPTADPHWQRLHQLALNHAKTPPKLAVTKALICTEGLPAVRLHTQGGDFLEHTHFLTRGDPNQKGEIVTQGFLQVLMQNPDQEKRWQAPPPAGWRTSYQRRALAEWLTDVDHGAGHLLARVIVNRLWQHHLGTGVVATPSDFGLQGDRPTHPELLDFLASELIEHGWSLKYIHKLIMTSAVYTQSTRLDDARVKVDARNRLLWRRTPRRLEAEAIRDSLLAVSGQLDLHPFGPGTLDPNMKRRSIYFFVKRSQLVPMMVLFDGPDTLQGLEQRVTTTIAPQSLLLMNNTQVRGCAESLAKRVSPKEGLPLEDVVRAAYARALARQPKERELADSLTFLKEQAASYIAAGKDKPEQLALTDFCQALLGLNEFVYID
jgi:mono/diheme cytochrome c family protein